MTETESLRAQLAAVASASGREAERAAELQREIERPKAECDRINIQEAARAADDAQEIERLKEALRGIIDALGNGPCGQVNCEGCHYEMAEAADIARQALGQAAV